jgi:RNA polymerase sigma-70 factor (ECF subfamily)
MADQPATNVERREEKRLINRARRGDEQALRRLIDAHKDRLYAFIRRMIRSHHDAEDIAQDTFLKAFASLDTFSTDFRFSTWLFTIGYRLCLNAMRRRQSLTGEIDLGRISDDRPDGEHLAAESDEAKHLRLIVWNAVDRLSPPQRATVILFYRHGVGCQEIAQVLELPVATVKSHLHRARARLKEYLQPYVSSETSKLRILAGLAG